MQKEAEVSALLFNRHVAKALQEVQKVLDNNRNPQSPADVQHSYEDKYVLSECTVNTALSAFVNSLEPLGLKQEHLAKLRSWVVAGKSVQLSFEAKEECVFIRKEKRKEDSATQHVTTIETSILPKMEFSSKTVKTITEWFWGFSSEYKLSLICGSSMLPDDSVVLMTRKCEREIKTLSEDAPRPKVHLVGPFDVPLTWAMKHLSEDFVWEFLIDRSKETCHTPRRNEDTLGAREFFKAVQGWAAETGQYFKGQLFGLQEGDVSSKDISGGSIFSPVTPLFEVGPPNEDGALEPALSGISKLPSARSHEPSVMLPVPDIEKLLHRQRETIEQLSGVLEGLFKPPTFFTSAEGIAASIFQHISALVEDLNVAIDFVEAMITQQVIAAIGKVLSPSDFAEYMVFHNRKLFKEEFTPRPFSYAIRRPDRSPEGILSIESTLDDGSPPDPIFTICRHSTSAVPMRFPIGAATEVSFLGDRYVHAWVGHQFSGSSGMSLHLTARARQFSSFILLIGNIAGANVFQPKYGIIIQNKDDLKVALLLETIPTPKEFRDAIESLSPEQQRFAKAFRAMQLESTLFGVAVIQIKPLLEKLLKLPEDSLTKEIRLVEDIQEVFIKYQIPSDMLAYDGPQQASVKEKVLAVRASTDAVLKMVSDIRDEELRLIREAKEAAERERRLQEEQKRKLMEREREERSRRSGMLSKGASRGGASGGARGGAMPTGANRMKAKKRGLSLFGRARPSAAVGCAAPQMAMDKQSAAPVLAERAPSKSRRSKRAPASQTTSVVQSSATGSLAQPQSIETSPAPAKPSSGEAAPEIPSPADSSLPEVPHPQEAIENSPNSDEEFAEAEDYTKIPARLDAKFEVLDEDSCLRPTTIKVSNKWSKKSQESLLSKPVESAVGADKQKEEKDRAFDLLDSLTKSGSVVVDRADLHIVIAATHCFDKALLETLVQDNMNPIEKVERSTLIIATTIHDKAAADLIKPSRLDSCRAVSPALF